MAEIAAAAPESVLDLIDRRSSTRKFADVAITDEQRAAVLHAATRAPSAGAMMMYSIIDIQRQETLDRLSVLCDNQPFIAKAKWALVFVVDYCKWIDLFEHAGCFADEFVQKTGRPARRTCGLGDFVIAAQDAVIAAQTAVIAAEAVGLGSCYIATLWRTLKRLASCWGCPRTPCPSACWFLACRTRSALPRRIRLRTWS